MHWLGLLSFPQGEQHEDPIEKKNPKKLEEEWNEGQKLFH